MKPLAQNTMIQNRYLIVQLIGKGGMGEVYLAVDQRLGSAVALKRTFFAGDEVLGNAFEREARILARMRHPVLPKVSDHFLEGSEQYLVMEHISGDDLAKRLEAAQKPFPLSWVMFWADQLLDALSYLHSHEPPIIHRDIKPQNLKLTDENHIVLLDFGLSKSSTGNTNASAGTSGRSGSTGSTGSVVGYTPHYAPMEQIRGIGTNPRSDIYALSATLYQILTNTVPADALSRADAMLTGKADPIRPINELNPEVPQAISDVILKGMEVGQERRFESAREMQKTLRKAFASMQTAMTAETVAFTMPGENRAATDVPIARTMDKTEVMDFGRVSTPDDADSIATRVAGSSQAGAVVSDETTAFNAGDSVPRQADLKTEVYNAAEAIPFAAPDVPPVSDQPAETFATRIEEQTPFTAADSGTGAGPAQTVPIIQFETPAAADAGTAAEAAQPMPTPAAKPAAAKKSSGGKIAAIFGGLLALFVVGIAVVVGGWYFYNNYSSGAANTQPTPMPTPSIEATPSPEPTLESVYDANSNTNTSVDANTNTVATDTNANTAADVNTSGEPRTRPTQPRTTATPRGTTPPATRPTPAPTRGRPPILQ